jgi:competence protein ComEC
VPAASSIARVLDAQHGHLFPWVPVCLGTGIATYFALRFEPGLGAWAVVALAVIGLVALSRRLSSLRPLPLALALVLAGTALAAWRTHDVAAPVLEFRYYGPVEGRIVNIDRSASDAVRLTLDRVVLERTPPSRTPERVRVSLHGEQAFLEPVPGMTVIMTAHLSPPSGPVEPGGFDFRRQAWFQKIGAVGYTRTPALVAAPPSATGLWMTSLRNRISGGVQAALPGRIGAFAAAITTGDRSGMDQDTLDSLRASNLAHLLAISGLHMGLLTGFVFAAIRYGIAAFPAIALRWNVKKLAAVAALAAGAFYLGLSGGNVATERAYVMVAVMLLAVLLDRRALSLRSVALAAIIVLALRPEALVGPGFQMSFAATTALIGVFSWLRDRELPSLPGWIKPVAGVVLSSAVAGAATAPIGAAHFNQIAHYGLLANTLSVPLMGAVVIPGAVLAGILAPVGLGWIGLAIMAPAIAWILGVSDWVAGLDGALSLVPAPDAVVLPLVALGGLWIILWQGRLRLAGVAPLVLALVLWAGADRPDVLISSTGGLVGVMTDQGRSLSKPRGEGFAADTWLENDGDGVTQEAAAARPGFEPIEKGSWRTKSLPIFLVTGRDGAVRAERLCSPGRVVVTSAEVPRDGPCILLDRTRLEDAGGVSLTHGSDGPRIVATRDVVGNRPWTGRPDEFSVASGLMRAKDRLQDRIALLLRAVVSG